MVLRKSSEFLPYPTTPQSSHPDTQQGPNPASHLDINDADIPPIPQYRPRSPPEHQSPYDDPGNPWLDHPTTDSRSTVPASLQVGRRHYSTNASPGQGDLSSPLKVGRLDQHTPRSSSDSGESRDFWEDDEVREGDTEEDAAEGAKEEYTKGSGYAVMAESKETVPEIPVIRRKPVAASALEKQVTEPTLTPRQFSSNNPFRRDESGERTNLYPSEDLPQWASEDASLPGKGKEPVRDPAQGKFPYAMPAQTSFEGLSRAQDDASFNYRPQDDLFLPSQPHVAPPAHPSAPPPPVPEQTSPFSSQPPLIPVFSENERSQNPWATQEAVAAPLSIQSQSPQPPMARYSDGLLDRGQETGVVSLQDELQALPNAAEAESITNDNLIDFGDEQGRPGPSVSVRHEDEDHLHPYSYTIEKSTAPEDFFEPPDGPPPAKPPRPSVPTGFGNDEEFESPEGPPPTKPPRPAVVTGPDSDEHMARMTEQRNETYQIKHFNWFDHQSGKLRRSSMLTQNKNGPCPLLALVNALILGIREDSQAALDNALRAREQVTLGLIIETLMDELLSGNHGGLPDVDELNRFLNMLHTGMNANPRFVSTPEPAPNLMDARNSMLHVPQSKKHEKTPGTFETTQDIKLYSSFAVPLIHGWLPSKRDGAWKAFAKSAPTYEDAQAIQFGEEELEYKLSNGGLTQEEQDIWQDIVAIKEFLRLYPTQITPYGLEVIREWLIPGQFAILFRNDHFSTIYKHPESGKLFTLVTDAGYADRDEIIWESLNDHRGNGEFFSGDFKSVSNNVSDGRSTATASDPSGPRGSSRYLSAPITPQPLSPQEQQEQHDADFAMALQLQEEEEQRQRAGRRSGPGQRQPEGIPIPLRQRQPQQEVRPLIPPRNARTPSVAVNRPSDNHDEDAPPAYEEAAKSKPYIPPRGSPHHPHADPSPRASTAQLTPTISAASSNQGPPLLQESASATAPGPRRLQQRDRRQSAYGENSMRHPSFGPSGPSSPSISRTSGHGYGIGVGNGYESGRHGRHKGGPSGDRDCVVM